MHAPDHLPASQRARRPARQAFAVAVTGHCHLGDASATRFAEHALGGLLARMQRAHPQGVVALSGLAIGADTIFAEAALACGIPLEACLACAEIAENFAPGQQRERFSALVERSRHVHWLPFVQRSNDAYMALGRWLVDSSDLLIAVWNGLPAAALGGTGDVVVYARQRRRTVIHVHIGKKTIRLL